MTRKRHTEEQIIAVLKDAQAGIGVQELCRKHGISDASFYKWRMKYAGLEVSDVKKLHQLEDENRRLKQMVVEQAPDIQSLKALTAKKLVAPKAKRAAAQWVAERFGLSERRVCRLVTLDRNTLQYQSWRSGAQGEDTRDRRDHATLRLPQDLRAAVTGRLEGESPEGLSGSIERKRSCCAAGRRRNPHPSLASCFRCPPVRGSGMRWTLSMTG
jgi:putative transposase